MSADRLLLLLDRCREQESKANLRKEESAGFDLTEVLERLDVHTSLLTELTNCCALQNRALELLTKKEAYGNQAKGTTQLVITEIPATGIGGQVVQANPNRRFLFFSNSGLGINIVPKPIPNPYVGGAWSFGATFALTSLTEEEHGEIVHNAWFAATAIFANAVIMVEEIYLERGKVVWNPLANLVSPGTTP